MNIIKGVTKNIKKFNFNFRTLQLNVYGQNSKMNKADEGTADDNTEYNGLKPLF